MTNRIALGTCINQVPRRNPVELAHRMMTVNLLAGDRLLWGVGAGSTQDDFAAVGEDYEGRFKKLRSALPTMKQLWAGETIDGTNLQPWPEVRECPKILVGSWAGSIWIPRAAKEFDGWIASGHYTNIATMKEVLTVSEVRVVASPSRQISASISRNQPLASRELRGLLLNATRMKRNGGLTWSPRLDSITLF